MTEIAFTVPGDPKPNARHRTRVVQAGTRSFAQQYDSSENKANRADVRTVAEQAMREAGMKQLLDGPLELVMCAWISKPKSKRRKRPTQDLDLLFPVTKPDLDNLVKMVCDACEGVVFRNDAQICNKLACKRYTEARPHTLVVFRTLKIERDLEVDGRLGGFRV